MPVIRIGDESWELLKKWAVPLEDSPDDALRKVLQLAEEHRSCLNQIKPAPTGRRTNGRQKKVGRLSGGSKVPQEAYEGPILDTLLEMGGRGKMDEVLQGVERKVKHLLSAVDYETLPSGTDVRWRNTAAWARYELVKRGLLADNSQRGVWELTEEGKKAAAKAGK